MKSHPTSAQADSAWPFPRRAVTLRHDGPLRRLVVRGCGHVFERHRRTSRRRRGTRGASPCPPRRPARRRGPRVAPRGRARARRPAGLPGRGYPVGEGRGRAGGSCDGRRRAARETATARLDWRPWSCCCGRAGAVAAGWQRARARRASPRRACAVGAGGAGGTQRGDSADLLAVQHNEAAGEAVAGREGLIQQQPPDRSEPGVSSRRAGLRPVSADRWDGLAGSHRKLTNSRIVAQPNFGGGLVPLFERRLLMQIRRACERCIRS
jgi:hypothetical protein